MQAWPSPTRLTPHTALSWGGDILFQGLNKGNMGSSQSEVESRALPGVIFPPLCPWASHVSLICEMGTFLEAIKIIGTH